MIWLTQWGLGDDPTLTLIVLLLALVLPGHGLLRVCCACVARNGRGKREALAVSVSHPKKVESISVIYSFKAFARGEKSVGGVDIPAVKM